VNSISFALVDVFADEPLAGNPLAVVPDADGLPESVLPRIAREFNQAETTFLLAPTVAGADHRLRSFTAGGVEVYGAGHNALGAWWWLLLAGRLGRAGRWHQQIGTEVLPVEVGTDLIAMRQRPVRYGATVSPGPLGEALGVAVLDAQVADTGAGHLLVRVPDRDTVDAIDPDTGALRTLLLGAGAEGCYVYSLDPTEPDADAHARFFNPVAGIVEDPATGTAAGPLACLLRRDGRTGDRLVVMQGHRMGRPSRIEITLDGDTPTIAGRAVLSASGTMHLAIPLS
jgi:PhzF family phenazine biosynthesis protein